MILVDSSVWIDYFRGRDTTPSERLHALLGNELLAIGDLIKVEVLQGFALARDFNRAQRLLDALVPVVLGGHDIAVQAARNHRVLGARGITVRRAIDTIIATRCIHEGYALLHHDRDFDPFERWLGLRCVA